MRWRDIRRKKERPRIGSHNINCEYFVAILESQKQKSFVEENADAGGTMQRAQLEWNEYIEALNTTDREYIK